MKKRHCGYFSIPLYFVLLTFYIVYNKSRKNFWWYQFSFKKVKIHIPGNKYTYISTSYSFYCTLYRTIGFFSTMLFLLNYIQHLAIFCSIRKYETYSSMPWTICSHYIHAKWMQITDLLLQCSTSRLINQILYNCSNF